MALYFILVFLLGGGLGYLIFFLRYEHRGLIDDLRDNFNECKRQLENVQHDAQEHLQQNVILKEKTTELMTKNDDLSRIVSELSRYYYHIKMGAEKAAELEKILHITDKDIEEKMKYTLGEKILESLNDGKKETSSPAPSLPPQGDKNRVMVVGGGKKR
ncbi:hypothetical protein KBC03_01290 [Patescibacteria group bacterium]|jgi:predicted nuclease with TOPRIM domain|nr:hypothetical protein [Patescibacteria group bacterium]